jgi:hypothetical protein
MKFRYNPNCSCARCRAHGYMGPVIMITIGVLFLLDQLGHTRWLDFGSTWPALLIVIGLVMFLQHNASAEGHVARPWPGMPAAPMPPYPPPPPVVTPPPVPPAGTITPGANWNNAQNPNDPEVRNG